MSNTTDEYWEIDGVSLQTLAFNVRTVGPKWSMPAMRGSDRSYAFKPGALHRARTPDSNTLSLGMWVIGGTEDGAGGDRGALFGDNMTKLRRLFRPPGGREFVITKRWYDSDGLHEASGHGKVVDQFSPENQGGPNRANFVLDILMADPFFYGEVETVEVAKDTDVVVTNTGDETTTAIVVELDGILANPVFTNKTYDPDVWLKVGSAIADGDRITVGVEGSSAIRLSDSAKLAGAVTHSGARPWFQLTPGENTVRLSADSGAGSATLKFQPIYF